MRGAQDPTVFRFQGNVVIQGGGVEGNTWNYTGDANTGTAAVETGDGTITLAMPPIHPTLVIRRHKLFGDSCSTRAECYYTDSCKNNGPYSPTEHQAEQNVLWEVEAQLEKNLMEPLRPDCQALLAAARERLVAGSK